MNEQNKTLAINLLLEIVRIGLLRIRAFGNSGDAAACAEEADHIHDVPDIVRDFRWERVEFYWRVLKPSFVQRTQKNVEQFQAAWTKLDQLMALPKSKDREPGRGA